jgi:hypothetical protein
MAVVNPLTRFSLSPREIAQCQLRALCYFSIDFDHCSRHFQSNQKKTSAIFPFHTLLCSICLPFFKKIYLTLNIDIPGENFLIISRLSTNNIGVKVEFESLADERRTRM